MPILDDVTPDIQQRSQKYNQQTITSFPLAVAHGIGMLGPPYLHDGYADTLNQLHDYMMARTSFAGIPGWLLSPMGQAASHSDPFTRSFALTALDGLRRQQDQDAQKIANMVVNRDKIQPNPMGEPGAIMGARRGNAAGGPGTATTFNLQPTAQAQQFSSLEAGTTPQQLSAAKMQAQVLSRADKKWADYYFTLRDAFENSTDPNQARKVRELYYTAKLPQQKFLIQLAWTNATKGYLQSLQADQQDQSGYLYQLGETTNNLLAHFYAINLHLGQSLADLGRLKFEDAGKKVSQAAADTLGVISSGGSTLGQLIGGAVGTPLKFGGEMLSKLGAPGRTIRGGFAAAIHPISLGFHGISGVGNMAGGAIASMVGLHPGDPGYDQIVGTVSFAVTAELLKGSFGAGKALRLGLNQPEIAGALEKGAGEDLGLKTILGRSVPNTVREQLIKQFGGPVMGRLNMKLYELISHPVEEWTNTNIGRRYGDAVWDVIQKGDRKTATGRLMMAFKGFTGEPIDAFAKLMSKAKYRAEIDQHLIALWKPTPGETVADLQLKSAAVTAEWNSLASRVSKQTEPALPEPWRGYVDSESVRIADIRRFETSRAEDRGPTDHASVTELADNIQEHGFQKPISIRQLPDGKFEIVDGLHRLHAAEQLGMERIPARIVKSVNEGRGWAPVGKTPSEFAPGQFQPEPTLTSSDVLERIDQLRQQRNIIDGRLMAQGVPQFVWRLPKTGRWIRVKGDVPLTKFEEFLSGVYRPSTLLGIKELPMLEVSSYGRVRMAKQSVRLPSLNRIFDNMKSGVFWHPHDIDAPPDWRTQNSLWLRGAGDRLGLTREQKELLQTLNAQMANEKQYQDAASLFGEAVKASPYVGPGQAGNIGLLQRRDYTDRAYSYLGEDALLRDKDGRPLPSELSQMSNSLRLPSLSHMVNATSYTRNLIRSLYETQMAEKARREAGIKGHGASSLLRRQGPNAILMPYTVARGLMDLSTAVMKSPVLLVRVLGLALPARVNADEWVRNYFKGYKGVVRGKGDFMVQHRTMEFVAKDKAAALKTAGREGIVERVRQLDNGRWSADLRIDPHTALKEVVEQNMGLLKQQFINPFDVRPAYHATPTQGIEPGMKIPAPIMDGMIRRIRMAASSIDMQALASLGPEGWVKWLEGGGRKFRASIKARADEGNVTLEQLAKLKWNELREITLGDPSLFESVASGGHWSIGASIKQALGEEDISPKLAALLRHHSDIQSSYMDELKGEANPERLSAMLDAKKQLTLDIEAARDGKDTINLLKRPQVAKQVIRNLWNQGKIKLPSTVVVEKYEVPETGTSYQGEQAAWKISRYMFDSKVPHGIYQMLDKIDRLGARGSYLYQSWNRWYQEARARGVGEEAARHLAGWRAARDTVDQMYDLSARSSLHLYFKNMFWFLPAFQEVLETYLFHIPSEGYLPLGLAAEAGTVFNLYQYAQSLGIISKGPDGKDRIVLPHFFGKLLGLPEGGPNKSMVYGYPSGLNLVGTGYPGASFGGVITLAGMAHYIPAMKGVGDWITHHLGSLTVAPQLFNYAYEFGFGKPPGWEVFSREQQQATYDMAFNDSAAMALYELQQQGKNMPRAPRGNLTQAEQNTWRAKRDAYLHEWQLESERIYKGRAFALMIGSVSSPFALHVTSTYRDEVNSLFSKFFTDNKFSPQEQLRLDTWLGQHPGSIAYRAFRTRVVGQHPTGPTVGTSLDEPFVAFQRDKLQRQALTPGEFQTAVQGMNEFQVHSQMIDSGLRNISENLDPAAILSHGWERGQVLDKAWQQYDNWKKLNPTPAGWLQARQQEWAQSQGTKGYPGQSLDALRAGELYHLIRNFLPKFQPGGYTDAEYNSFKAKVVDLWNSTNPNFGKPTSKLSRAFASYFTRVQPYWDGLHTLYQQIDYAKSRGQDTSSYFSELRALKNKWNGMNWGSYPSPEALSYNNMSPPDRAARLIHWQSQPATWLSNFELSKSGYPDKLTPMFGQMADVETRITNLKNNLGTLANNQKLNDLQTLMERGVAIRYGAEGLRFFDLMQLGPASRIAQLNPDVPDAFRELTQRANIISQIAQANGLSPGGHSQLLVPLKMQLFNAVDERVSQDNTLSTFMDEAGYALAQQGLPIHGDRLYDGLFFGEFQFPFIRRK